MRSPKPSRFRYFPSSQTQLFSYVCRFVFKILSKSLIFEKLQEYILEVISGQRYTLKTVQSQMYIVTREGIIPGACVWHGSS